MCLEVGEIGDCIRSQDVAGGRRYRGQYGVRNV